MRKLVVAHLESGDGRSLRGSSVYRFTIGAFFAVRVLVGQHFPDRGISTQFPQQFVTYSRSVKNGTQDLTPADLGSIVRATRKAQHLRQDELAGAAGVGLRFIVDLEAGKPTAQIGKSLQVLHALGCSIEITPPAERKA